jgi:hypothetical protein
MKLIRRMLESLIRERQQDQVWRRKKNREIRHPLARRESILNILPASRFVEIFIPKSGRRETLQLLSISDDARQYKEQS